MSIYNVNVSNIDYAYFNPPARTSSEALRSLREDIEGKGVLAPVHLVSAGRNRYVAADGNRRIACCVELGVKTIEAKVYPEGSNIYDLWATLNSKTRSMRGADWLAAYFMSGGKMNKMPSSPKATIERCESIFGWAGLAYLVEKETPPSVCIRIDQLFGRLTEKRLAEGLSRKQVGMWIVRHGLESAVSDVLKISPTAKTLKKVRTKIVSDRAFGLIDVLPASRVATSKK